MYVFSGFDKEAINVQSDLVITAKYSRISIPEYSVVFKEDNTILYETTVKEGSSVTYPKSNPTKKADSEYSYQFVGWNYDLSNIKENVVVRPVYQKTPINAKSYTVTYKNYDGTVLYSTKVKAGGDVTYPYSNPSRLDDSNYRYIFKGFDKEAKNIQWGKDTHYPQ